jgi:hypothetical protein
VDAELTSWWPVANAAHAPVLFAWSAVLLLTQKAGEGGGGKASPLSWEGHAVRANEADALGALCTLSSHGDARQQEKVEMVDNILLGVVAAILAAFNMDPGAMPLQRTRQLTTTIANLFRGASGDVRACVCACACACACA